jgi:hypothetical protein
LADAGYGDSTEFRDAIAQRGLHYVVAVNGEPVVWPPDSAPRVKHCARRPWDTTAVSRHPTPTHCAQRACCGSAVQTCELARRLQRLAERTLRCNSRANGSPSCGRSAASRRAVVAMPTNGRLQHTL